VTEGTGGEFELPASGKPHLFSSYKLPISMTDTERSVILAKREWIPSCRSTGVRIELLIGRALAYCAHPHAAWRRLTPHGRVLLVAAYFGGGYTAVMVALIVSGR
jgi:hypothetical protein